MSHTSHILFGNFFVGFHGFHGFHNTHSMDSDHSTHTIPQESPHRISHGFHMDSMDSSNSTNHCSSGIHVESSYFTWNPQGVHVESLLVSVSFMRFWILMDSSWILRNTR